MNPCSTCGNHYERSFEVTFEGRHYTFDCIECAAHQLAPSCEHCGCKVLGHGVQADEHVFCCAHCAREQGVSGLETHVGAH